MARAELDICALERQARAELEPLVAEAIAQVAATVPERTAQLEALAAEMLASYHRTSDGYRGRVGQVQIARWRAVLDGEPGG